MLDLSEAQSNLRYQLKMNEMILISGEKQTLIECIAGMLGLESPKLHQIICSNLTKCLEQFTLPRKLSYIRKDNSIIDDYKKYPELVNFMKITLEMVSQIYETKIIVFYLNNQNILTGLIVNEKAYQSEIKVGRINNYFYQIKESFASSHSNQSAKLDPSSSNQSYKFYQVFDIEPLPKKIQSKPIDVKSYTIIPGSPLLKKNASLCQDRIKPIVPDSQKLVQVSSPNNPSTVITNMKQFDQISLQNIVDDQQLYSAHHLAQSIKFGHQPLTQSLTIQKNVTQPAQQIPTITQEPSMIHPQEQVQNQNTMFYGYYSQHMYYPPAYLLNQGSSRNEGYNNNFGNVSTTSVSPGKNSVRRQGSTLEINENERYTGRLKFFDEGKNYGFIIMDADESDIFVHCDDLQKAGISKERVRSYKQSEGAIRFSFKVMSYFGKYRESRKAVDLIILDDGLGMPSLYT